MTEATSAPGGAPRRVSQPRLGPVEFDVRVWVYGTITLMSVLVVFDGWAELDRPILVAAAIVGPTLALALAHLFADVLDFHTDHRHPPTLAQFRRLVGHSMEYLLVGLPPLVVLVVAGWITGSPPAAIRWMIYLGTASLGVWGLVAGWRVGYRGWRLAASVLAGLLIGVIIIALQVALKPH